MEIYIPMKEVNTCKLLFNSSTKKRHETSMKIMSHL